MSKKKYVSNIDKLPFIVKLLLALPLIDGIAYGAYRIIKGYVIIGILWIILGSFVLWIVDIISICIFGKIKIFA